MGSNITTVVDLASGVNCIRVFAYPFGEAINEQSATSRATKLMSVCQIVSKIDMGERLPCTPALSPADLRSLFDIFSRHARVILFPIGNLAPGKVYPVGAIMRQTSTDFYKWYTAESETTTRIPVLGFTLLDVHRKANQSFLVDAANLQCFQMPKQNIWDSFWYTLYLNGAPPLFEISVSHLLANAPDLTTRLQSHDMPAGSSVNMHAGFGSAPRVQLAACESEKTTRKISDVYQLLN